MNELAFLPPHDIELEKCVLGALILEPKSYLQIQGYIYDDCFYKEEHKQILSIFTTLFERRAHIDILTILNEANKKESLRSEINAYFLAELTNSVISAANIQEHAQLLGEYAIRRNMLIFGQNTSKLAMKNDVDCFQALDEVRQMVDGLDKFIITNDMDIQASTKEYEKNISQKINLITLQYGLEIERGNVMIIAARPGVGKSAISMNLCKPILQRREENIIIISYEMTKSQIIARLVADITGLNNREQRFEENFFKVKKAIEEINKFKLFIIDKPKKGTNFINSTIQSIAYKNGNIALVIIDYLQLIRENGKFGNREAEISTISREIKSIAKSCDVPIMALSQLNRDVEKEKRKPGLSDLRESGAIEQDADIVCFVHREKNKETQFFSNDTEFYAGKNRQGSLQDFYRTLEYIPNKISFEFYQRNYTDLDFS